MPAQRQALARMYALVQSQAAVLSYVEVYWLLAISLGGYVCRLISAEEK